MSINGMKYLADVFIINSKKGSIGSSNVHQ